MSNKITPDSSQTPHSLDRRNLLLAGTALAAVTALSAGIVAPTRKAMAQAKLPNILVIWGDDIGMWNVGAYCNSMMGKTPNIDRIGKEGIIFTDHYGQPSCTA